MSSGMFFFLATLVLTLFSRALHQVAAQVEPYPITPHVLQLSQKPFSLQQQRDLVRRSQLNASGTAPIRVGESYLVNITFGNETLPIEIDTGSTDLWVAETGFACIDFDSGHEVAESQCDIPRAYNVSSTFERIDGSFDTAYVDGEQFSGITGYEKVTIAGITVDKQRIGVVNNITWLTGDGYCAGVVGFGFWASPNAISAGDIAKTTNATDNLENPLFPSLYASGLIPPVFSLALNRSSGLSGGVLGLGGIPNVTYILPFASAPLENSDGTPPSDEVTGQIYQISVGGVTYQAPTSGSKTVTNSTPFQVTVDSGTPDTYLPNRIAAGINRLFDPPGKDIGGGIYSIGCQATAPLVGIIIGNQSFYMNVADLIANVGPGDCISSIIGGDTDQGSDYILGGTFLNNVLAVFDVGNGQISFASRETREQLTATATTGSSPTSTSTGSSGHKNTGVSSVVRVYSYQSRVPFLGAYAAHLLLVSLLCFMI